MRDTRLFPTPFLRISDARVPRGHPRIPHALRGAQHPPHLRCENATRTGRIGDAIWPHEMDASEMRKAGNPTCMHVGTTKRHDTTARRRCATHDCFPPPSCASPTRAYRVVIRVYPTPCVGLNTLRIFDAKMPHELDASEMRYGHTRWTHRRCVRRETPRACTWGRRNDTTQQRVGDARECDVGGV